MKQYDYYTQKYNGKLNQFKFMKKSQESRSNNTVSHTITLIKIHHKI